MDLDLNKVGMDFVDESVAIAFRDSFTIFFLFFIILYYYSHLYVRARFCILIRFKNVRPFGMKLVKTRDSDTFRLVFFYIIESYQLGDL